MAYITPPVGVLYFCHIELYKYLRPGSNRRRRVPHTFAAFEYVGFKSVALLVLHSYSRSRSERDAR